MNATTSHPNTPKGGPRSVLRAIASLALVVLAFLGAACGSSDSVATDATLTSFKVGFADGSIPPEYHTSSRLLVEGTTFTTTHWREYGEVLESETTIELTDAQLAELNRLVREGDLRRVDRVDDGCVGGGGMTVDAQWSDGGRVQGGQDHRTYRDGPGSRCPSYSVVGDFASAADYLLSL